MATVPDKTLGNFNFPNQQTHYTGKTREVYFTKDEYSISIATNRLSAFNHVFEQEVPYKGAVLNMIAAHFLKTTKHIAPNWFEAMPNAVTTVGLRGKIVPYEIVVRGYLAGSAWRIYKKGGRTICGITLPEGLKENDRLPHAIITPTRKSENDEPITREEILAEGKVSQANYEQIEKFARALFADGQKSANERGLILVDTKYEFMLLDDGEDEPIVVLADEIHTPDSSRYFYLEGYDERQKNAQKQEQLSKEFFREWLMEQGYGEQEAEKGIQPPVLTEGVINTLSLKYIRLYEKITGETFPYELADKAKEKEHIYFSTRMGISTVRAKNNPPVVGIVMGSDSDLPVMDNAALTLEEFGISYELTIASAHRTPERMEHYAKTAAERGLKVVIAGAGGAAHLPGMVAGHSTLPVIGVPILSSNSIAGIDSILSILQMPDGIPVLTVARNGAKNAAIAAVSILGAFDNETAQKMRDFKRTLSSKVLKTVEKVKDLGYPCIYKEEDFMM
jgi:phosphoribosylaminoimidazole-succinocarboxamide synthase